MDAHTVDDEWSIGALNNLDEAVEALNSLKSFIKTDQNWDFNQYIREKRGRGRSSNITYKSLLKPYFSRV